MTLRQGGDANGEPPAGPSQYVVAPGTTDLVNMGDGPGFGSGDSSTIGAEDDFNEGKIEDDLDEGKIKNGGFTAMIIRNDGDPETNRPTIAFDLDEGNDGLDVPTPGSGSQGAPLDYRQSFTGEHGDLASGDTSVPPRQPTEDDGKLESNQGVPYGTKLLDNVGAPNYITGDFNGNGVVDAADYSVGLASLGATATEFAHEPADRNHDFLVDATDYTLWKANFGAPLSPAAAAASPSAAVPEPTAAILLLIAGITAVTCRVHPV